MSGFYSYKYDIWFDDYDDYDAFLETLPPTRWSIWWDSESLDCEDSIFIEAETKEEAIAEFEWLVDTGRDDLPEDAKIESVNELD